MTFDEVLTQALALLKRQGRVSYSALKRRFDLDDAYLNDLKDELLYVHASEVEVDDRGFTWTGGTEDRQATPGQSDQTAPQSVVEHAPPVQAISAPAEAERRQLTVLFCDLVDSTVLSSLLDPEELREVVRAYQDTCAKVIARFDGYIAQYLGDGLLVYFGYPLAHEDDAQRAVRAGLGMLDALGQLTPRLEQEHGVRLAARLGVHTGLVVVGEVGGGARQEQLALGETPNLAARLQGLAAPNTLVISATTFQLLGGFFACQPLGTPPLKGLAQPLAVYRVLYESMARSRLEAVGSTGWTPLVGREQDIGLLRECWAQVKEGVGQMVLLSGEAGIGKSRLVQVLQEHVAAEPQAWLTPCQCSPYHQNTALYPLIDLLERVALRFEREESPQQKLSKLEGFVVQYGLPLAETVPLLAALLSLPLPADYAPLTVSPEQQRQQTLHALLTILLHIAAQQPVLFVMEDLHWVDPSTLEFLTLLVDQGPTARILALCTFRPDFSPPWTGRSHLTQVTVHRLPQRQAVEVIRRVAHGKTLPAEVVEQIVAKTDGVPLFVEELTKMVLESGLLQEQEGRYALTGPLPPLAIPATLHDSLLARLDRLETVKALAQLGATLGREFSYELLRAVSPWDEATLQRGLHHLVEAEFLYQQGLPPQATYVFKHALIQEAAYNILLIRQRQALHRAVGVALEELYPERLAEHYEELAHHFTQGEEWAKAMAYSTLAGDRAADAFANAEAKAHYTGALHAAARVTRSLEPGALARLHAKHGAVLTVLGAYEGAVAAYQRALELIRQTADRRGEIDMLAALSLVYRRYHREALAIASIEQALAMARAIGDRACEAFCLAHRVYIRSSGYGQLAETTPDAEEAVRLAREIGDPKLVMETLIPLGRVLQWRAVFDRSLVYLREGVELARQRPAGFLFGQAAVFLGNAYTATGAYEEALRWYQQLSDYASKAEETFFLARVPNLVGGVHLDVFDLDEALRLNLEGAEVAQRFYPWPEPHCHSLVKAGLAHLYRGEHGLAEACFRHAEVRLEEDTWLRWRWHIALLHALGELALTQGRHDDAWTYATQSLELATQTDSRKHVVRAQRLQGEVLAAREQLEDAAQALAASVQMAEYIQTPREVWLGKAALGTVLARLGRDKAAEAQLTQATQTIEAIAANLHTLRLRHSFLSAPRVLVLYAALGHRPPQQDEAGG